MGVDIDVHVEEWTELAGWDYVKRPQLSARAIEWYGERNYPLFQLLAGNPLSDPSPLVARRGLPVDASEALLREFREYQGVRATWYSLQELVDHVEVIGAISIGFAALVRALDLSLFDLTDRDKLRVVMWFDV